MSSERPHGRQQCADLLLNFVTCHDGFTLNDLVSYNDKHNEANGEENRDGLDSNLSWNCGVEGSSDEPAIVGLRHRQMKKFFVILLLSVGTPMLQMGDEICRTQGATTTPTARIMRWGGSTGVC